MLYSTQLTDAGYQSTVLPEPVMRTANSAKGHFEIHSLDWLQQNGLLVAEQSERIPWYEWLWFTTGQGTLVIDSTTYPVKPNAIYCYSPGRVRTYQLDENAKGYRIVFSPDFLYVGNVQSLVSSVLDVFDARMSVPVVEADPEMQGELTELVFKMQKEFANYYLLRSEILSGFLNILMIHYSRKLQSAVPDPVYTREVELVRRFKVLLKQHFISKKIVADYASALCVTPNYLNRTIKRVTGLTASYHIQQQIILEAKRQAIHANASMKEIAYYLGFDNLAHFSKYFKNNTGMSFTNFKRSLGNSF
jgi:AraC family transcriptional regulator, transcriptional activator of pobA